MFRQKIRRQISVYLKLLAEFRFGHNEGSFLLLNGQKHLRSVADDFVSNKQKELRESIKNSKGINIIKLSSKYL